MKRVPVKLRSQRAAAVLLSLLSLAPLVGCGGAESEVSGTVTLDGKAVGPGIIVFAPADGQSNPSDGAIQPNGEYYLRTSGEVGLKAGKYRVGVNVLDQPEVRPGERSMEAAKRVTPERYVEPATSGLEFDVTPGSNSIDVQLTSKETG
jgi:hypothetical protein